MERKEIRQALIYERKLCDWCLLPVLNNKFTHMHELVMRSRVYRNANDLIFQPELCAILHGDCHEQVHELGQEAEKKLWKRLFFLYGKDVVMGKLNKLFEEVQCIVHLPD